jgi:hypothetical protein
MQKTRYVPGFLLALLAATLLGSGCAVTRGLAVRSFLPVLRTSVEETYRDRDLATVREAIPANLILLRGMCESEPGNEELRRLTVQMYYSYAMGFVEDEDPSRANLLYEEGLRIGREGLMRENWFRRAESQQPLPGPENLACMDRDDVPLAFWTLANWSSWIALNESNPEAVSQFPRVQAYLDRILVLEPDFFFGMPHVMEGSLLSFLPRMFGGNPEEGRKQFEEGFRISGGKMLLYKVLYARYYCRQMLDEACFSQSLEEVLNAPPDLFPEYRLLNELARVKAKALLESKNDLF